MWVILHHRSSTAVNRLAVNSFRQQDTASRIAPTVGTPACAQRGEQRCELPKLSTTAPARPSSGTFSRFQFELGAAMGKSYGAAEAAPSAVLPWRRPPQSPPLRRGGR